MVGVEVLSLLAGGLIGLGVAERALHASHLHKLPTRIHVSGTRGKSSVTRLIHAGLNAGGISTAAKTTGTLARMILPDHREFPIYRPLGANIIEQKRVVSAAINIGAEALVAECMALQPLLHWVSENMLIKATHGVITNARADHLDIMGPTEKDVALTLAGMIPIKGVLYTAEQKHLETLTLAANDRGTRVVSVDEADVNAVTDKEMAGFCYTEHKENVALVLRILSDFGIDRQTAIQGMWNTHPDPGAMSEYTLNFYGRKIIFINGFAANDPESTKTIWRYSLEKHHEAERVIGIFNLRGDRPSRTHQFAHDANFWHRADNVILMGSGAYLFARIAAQKNQIAQKLIHVDSERMDDILEQVLEVCGKTTLIVGMGNIGGQGLKLVRYFKNRSVPEEQ